MRNTNGLGSGWDHSCDVCGKVFRAVSNKQTVCSTECRFNLYQNKGGENDCWEWSGPVNNQGYGVLFLNVNKENGRRKVAAAHRYSYELSFGNSTAGMCIMHTCDNRRCTNPAHLVEGTWADNNKDRSQKGRSGSRVFSDAERASYSEKFKGESNPVAKLTEAQAIEIKYDRTLGCVMAAKKYGVSPGLIKNIRAGRAWRHI